MCQLVVKKKTFRDISENVSADVLILINISGAHVIILTQFFILMAKLFGIYRNAKGYTDILYYIHILYHTQTHTAIRL